MFLLAILGTVGSVVVSVSAVLAFIVLVCTSALLPPVKWVWRKLVSDPVTQWAAKVSKDANAKTEEALEKLTDEFTDHKRYVGHHLGPNGTTKPVHARLGTLEEAVAKKG